MPQDLSEINASSRRGMVCPQCGRKGLKENQQAAQAFQGQEKLLYATGCQTPNCGHHHKTGEPIPRNAIEQQLDDGGRTFDPRALVARASLKTLGVSIAVLIIAAGLFIALNGVPGGTTGTASATNISVTEDPTNFEKNGTVQNWTLFRYGSQCLASATIDGETVYIDKSGAVTSDPVLFSTCDAAEDAVLDWAVDNPTNETVERNPAVAKDPESPWTLYASPNGSQYVIAAEWNGSIVFLAPNGSIIDEPYVFDSYDAASGVLLEWNTENLAPDVGMDATKLDPVDKEELEIFLEEAGLDWYDTGGGGGGGGGGGFGDSIDGNETEGNATVGSKNVNGIVTYPNGDPIEGATVKIQSDLKTTTTGPDGQYSFENITAGEHTLWVTPPSSIRDSYAVPRRTTVLIDSQGDMNVSNPPQSVSFFRDSEGYIANNQLDYLVPKNRVIEVVGNGSSIGGNITFGNKANANDVTVNLSSVATSSERELQFNASSPLDFTARGNTQPRNPELTLYGDSKATDKMLTGNSTKATHTLKGNQPIENPKVELEGFQEVSSLKQQQAASGNSQTFTVGGNRPTINHQIWLSGDTESRSISTSKSQNSFTHDIRGNLRPQNVQFQVTGQENTNNRRVTGEIKDDELTVQVNGNQPAENVQLQLNGQSWTGTVTTEYFSGSGGTCYWGDCSWLTKTQTIIPAPPDGSTREYILDVEGNWHDGNYDGGQTFSLKKHVEPYKQWHDGIFGDPYTTTENTTQLDSWSTTCGYSTCDPTGTEPPIDARKEVTVSRPEHPDNPNNGKLAGSFNGQSYDDLDISVEVIQKQKTRDVSVSGPGISGTYRDNVGGSGSSTINIGSLSPGTHTFDIQTSGEQGVDYELTFQERSVTENLRVNVDENTRCSQNTVPGSTTCTVDSSNVSPSSTLSFSSNGPTPEVSMSYTARAGVASGTVNMGGQTFNYDHTNNGMSVLTSGDTYEMSTNAFSPGQKELTVQSQSVDGMNPTLQAVVEYKERTATKNVRFMHDGSAICQKPNALTGSASCDIADSTLVGGDNITIKANGLPVEYELGYGAVAKVDTASITVDGNEFTYPSDFNKTQPLGTDEKATVELNSLSLGDHSLDMSTIETNGVGLDGKAQLSYIGDILTSYKPAVVIVNPNGTVHEVPVPTSELDSGRLTENTTIDLPQKYFDNGENKVVVRTADGSFIRADLEATGLNFQAATFERGANVTAAT